MSLYQCGHCGCVENTACGTQHAPEFESKYFDWTGMEDRKNLQLCSACGPTRYSDGAMTEYGKWHGRFGRVFLPMGMFKTNRVGNLEHIETGSEKYGEYAIPSEKVLAQD